MKYLSTYVLFTNYGEGPTVIICWSVSHLMNTYSVQGENVPYIISNPCNNLAKLAKSIAHYFL